MPPDKNFYQICYFEGKYKENLNILFKHSNIFPLSVTVYLNFLFLSLLFSPPNLFIDFVLCKLKTRLYWEKSKFQKKPPSDFSWEYTMDCWLGHTSGNLLYINCLKKMESIITSLSLHLKYCRDLHPTYIKCFLTFSFISKYLLFSLPTNRKAGHKNKSS